MKLVLMILAIVFSCIGVIYTGIAGATYIMMDQIIASPNSRGNVELLPAIFGLLGVSFLMIGIVFGCLLSARNRRRRKLVEEGHYVMAEVVDVYQNRYVTIGSLHPYIVECLYYDPYNNTQRTFKSENIKEDPSQLMGRQLPVYIDPQNEKHYYVDTDYLREG